MITLDQIFARTPINSLAGTEILLTQKAGVTGGTLLSTLKSFIKSGFVANDVTDATTLGKQVMTVADLAAAKTLLEIPVTKAPVTLTTNTTLGAAHINRRVFVTNASAVLTLNSANLTNADSYTIINMAASPVTINVTGSEDIQVKGATGATVTTYSLAAKQVVRIYLADADTWYFEV